MVMSCQNTCVDMSKKLMHSSHVSVSKTPVGCKGRKGCSQGGWLSLEQVTQRDCAIPILEDSKIWWDKAWSSLI